MKLKQIVVRVARSGGRAKSYSMITDDADNLFSLTWWADLSEETTKKIMAWASIAGFGDEYRPRNAETADGDWLSVKAECRKPPYEHAVKTCAYVKVAPAAAPAKKKQGRKKKKEDI